MNKALHSHHICKGEEETGGLHAPVGSMNWYDLWEEPFDSLQRDLKCARLSSYTPPCAQHSRPSVLCTALVVKRNHGNTLTSVRRLVT